jgi:hypothetical protein
MRIRRAVSGKVGTTRAERDSGINRFGEMRANVFADHIDAAHGTVKRWLHEGMPARRTKRLAKSGSGSFVADVWINPVEAKAWIVKRFKGKVPTAIGRGRGTFVYLAARLDNESIKVGWSNDIMRRVAELRKETGSAIELIACFPGKKPDELRMHKSLAAEHRFDGEFFHVSRGVALSVFREVFAP